MGDGGGQSPAVVSGCSILELVQWHGVAEKGCMAILAAVLEAAQKDGGEEAHPIVRDRGTTTSYGSPSY